jgi:succinyl-CoA synthetase beta subunit
MLDKEILEIIQKYKEQGWIPEPEAKRLFSISGLKVPVYKWAKTQEEAVESANRVKYPVVAKIVSSKVVHKSEVNGVIIGITNDKEIKEAYGKLSASDGFEGILIDEMLRGVELIIGAKIDYQFGPVIMLGIGGTGVEIYKDITIRMAPINKIDVISMINSLKGQSIITGFRGSEPVNLEDLSDLLTRFSELVMDLEDHIESIDLNPVMCSREKCVIADARIMLKV